MNNTEWVVCPVHPLAQLLLVCRVLTLSPLEQLKPEWRCIPRGMSLPPSFRSSPHTLTSMSVCIVCQSVILSFTLALLPPQSAAVGLMKLRWYHLASIYVAVYQFWQAVHFSWCLSSMPLFLEMKPVFRRKAWVSFTAEAPPLQIPFNTDSTKAWLPS